MNAKRLVSAGAWTAVLLMSACAAIQGESRWQEEVRSYDGSTFIVERAQTRGGRHEIGQAVPINKHTISFFSPGSSEVIRWTTEFGLEKEKADLFPLAVDMVNGTAYIAATMGLCIGYNKWDRPNPPYVFFRYTGKGWQRIPLAQFPTQITEANIVIDTGNNERQLTSFSEPVSAEQVRRFNSGGSPEGRYLRVLAREPIKTGITVTCPVMVYYPDGSWRQAGWIQSAAAN